MGERSMRKDITNDCLCRSLTQRSDSKPLVVLTSKENLRQTQNQVAASLPTGSSSYGSSWLDPSGRLVSIKAYQDAVPAYPQGFDLKVCNGGATYSEDDLKGLQKWRRALSDG